MFGFLSIFARGTIIARAYSDCTDCSGITPNPSVAPPASLDNFQNLLGLNQPTGIFGLTGGTVPTLAPNSGQNVVPDGAAAPLVDTSINTVISTIQSNDDFNNGEGAISIDNSGVFPGASEDAPSTSVVKTDETSTNGPASSMAATSAVSVSSPGDTIAPTLPVSTGTPSSDKSTGTVTTDKSTGTVTTDKSTGTVTTDKNTGTVTTTCVPTPLISSGNTATPPTSDVTTALPSSDTPIALPPSDTTIALPPSDTTIALFLSDTSIALTSAGTILTDGSTIVETVTTCPSTNHNESSGSYSHGDPLSTSYTGPTLTCDTSVVTFTGTRVGITCMSSSSLTITVASSTVLTTLSSRDRTRGDVFIAKLTLLCTNTIYYVSSSCYESTAYETEYSTHSFCAAGTIMARAVSQSSPLLNQANSTKNNSRFFIQIGKGHANKINTASFLVILFALLLAIV